MLQTKWLVDVPGLAAAGHGLGACLRGPHFAELSSSVRGDVPLLVVSF